MRPSMFYRIAAIINLLFAVGHTIGFLSFQPKAPEGQAAVRAMAIVFTEEGTRFSYADFYKGFGLNIGLAMLLVAVLSWWLGGLARTSPRVTIVPGAALLAYHIGVVVLALLFFPVPPVIFSAALALLYAIALAGAARA